jgi:hypothetical protein
MDYSLLRFVGCIFVGCIFVFAMIGALIVFVISTLARLSEIETDLETVIRVADGLGDQLDEIKRGAFKRLKL